MKKLLVVLGAGASVEYGMPKVKDIDLLFDEWAQCGFSIMESRNNYKDNLYSWVKDDFLEAEIFEPSFEDYLHRIQTLASMGLNDGKFKFKSKFIYNKELPIIKTFNGEIHKANNQDFASLNAYLNGELLKFIRNKGKNLETEKSIELKKGRDFFNFLRNDFQLGFINLNYDNVLLSTLPELSTGFDKINGKYDINEFYCNDWNFCHHIHGSIHFDMRDGEEIFWNRDLNAKFGTGVLGRRSFVTPEGSVHPFSTIITGKDKINQIYREPFRQNFVKLDQRINESDTILFIGYGFNDSYLNELINTHAKDLGKRRNIVVIDYQDPNGRSLSEGGNDWGYRLLHTTHVPFNQMGNGSTNLIYRPDKVEEYSRTRTFEFSDSFENPLYVWYSGFLDACDNKEKILKALNGFYYTPDGCLSSTFTKY